MTRTAKHAPRFARIDPALRLEAALLLAEIAVGEAAEALAEVRAAITQMETDRAEAFHRPKARRRARVTA